MKNGDLQLIQKKTKYICTGEEKESLKFDSGEEIKPSTECTYLGTKIDHTGDNTTEIKHRINQTRKAINVLTLRLLMSYIYGAPILDVSRSYTTTHHSR